MEDQKVAVLLEDIAQKFNILAEAQESIRKDIRNIKSVTVQMYEDMEGVVKPTLKQQSHDLSEIKNQLNILTEEFIVINPDSMPRLKKIK